MTGPSRAVRDLVWDRDGGACVWCGQAVSPGWHGTGMTGCHGLITCDPEAIREAKRRKVVLSKLALAAPCDVPVLYVGRVWARLGDDGSWAAVATPVSDGV